MGFKLFTGFETREKKIRKYCSSAILELVDRGETVTWEQYQKMCMNSYEQYLMHPLLDDEALMNLIEYCIANCEHQRDIIPIHYDEAVIHELTPLLIKRMKELLAITEVPKEKTVL